MARRTVLTSRQRSALFSLPQHETDLLRHYTLSDEDLQHVEARRRSRNKLGFALQLCVLRYPGRLLAPGEFVPPAVVEFIGRQLDLDGYELADYAVRAETRHEHLAELRRLYGFRPFSGRAARELNDRLGEEAPLARSNEDLARRFVDACRQTRTILPATTTIERLCADALVDAERRIEARIAERVPSGLRRALEHLLNETLAAGVTRFVWLRQFEPGSNIDEGMLRIERTEAAVPDGAGDLVTDLYQRIPDTRITDILLEVDDAIRFTEAFTHLRTGAPCHDRIGLLNVLLAEGINLGLRKMAEATTTHGFWELMRIARWHVEGEAYDRALAVVVEAQATLPMAASWGPGRTASSDGQFFPAGGRGEALNLVNARYGTEPGVKAYSHVSDRFSPFATQTIPTTVHEAPYILDGLLMNETGRRIREQYADTGGFTDHVFAACSVLGYAFVPRIRDLPSKRLYVFERAGVPKRLRPLVGGKVNVDPDRQELG